MGINYNTKGTLIGILSRCIVLILVLSVSVHSIAQNSRFLQHISINADHSVTNSFWDNMSDDTSIDSNPQFQQISSETHVPQSDVLIVSTYSPDYSWAVNIIKYLKNNLSIEGEFSTSSIDLPFMLVKDRTDGDEFFSQMNNYIDMISPKVLVVLGCQGLNIIDRIHKLHPDIQILMVGGHDYAVQNKSLMDSLLYDNNEFIRLEDVRKRTGMSSFIIPIYINDIVDLIVKVRPELNIIYYISGEDDFSMMSVNEVRSYITENYPNLQIRSITPDKMSDSDLLNIASNSDASRCAAIFSSWVNRHDVLEGKTTIMNNLLYSVASQNIPVFVMRDNGWMEHSRDIVGGCFADDANTFSDLGDMVLRILNGENAADIEPVQVSYKVYKMNYMKMRSYGISSYQCPPETIYIDSPVTVLEKNPLLIVMYIIIITATFTLMIFVFRFFQNRVNSLKTKEDYFINALPLTFMEIEPIYSSDGIVRDGIIVSMNKLARKIISADSIGQRLSVVYPMSFTELFRKINMSAQNHNIGTEFTMYNEQFDQYLIYIILTLENGRLGIACMDNTASVKAERMNKEVSVFLKKQQEFLEYLPYSYVVLELVKDKRGRVVDGTVDYCNDHVTQVMKRTGTVILGESVRKMWPNLYKSSIEKLNEALRNNSPASLEAVYSTKYNKYFDIVFRITDNDHVGVMLIDRTTEVTSREQIIRTNEELKAAKLRAEASDKAKDSFIHNMSHEIRTPLNAIIGFAQLLSLPDSFITEDEKVEYREYILNSSEMLSMLIDDMLALSDNKADKYRVELTECHCNLICQKANKTVEYRIPDGVRLEFLTEIDNDYTIHSDPKRIQQVLINFLTNASKHTETGYIRTGVSTSMVPGKLTFYVEDTGCGVDPQYSEKIFEQFVMLNPNKDGKGLGLHICKDVSKLLHGEVKLDTTYTNGARFLFILDLDNM